MQTLKMDFQSQSTPPVVPVMQSDAQSRFIGITLYNGGVPYEAPEGASYTVQYRGPGANNMGWYDTIQLSSGTRKAVIVDSASKNVVTLELAEQALRVNGNVFVNLCVVTNTGYMLKTFPILCRVTGAAFPDTVAVQSFFYVTGITSEQWLAYVTACQDAQKRAEDAAATFETDPTLSVSGKAADAFTTGACFLTINNRNNIVYVPVENTGIFKTSGKKGTTSSTNTTEPVTIKANECVIITATVPDSLIAVGALNSGTYSEVGTKINSNTYFYRAATDTTISCSYSKSETFNIYKATFTHNATLNALDFGFKNDNSTDNSPIMDEFIKIADTTPIIFPAGKYVFSRTINFPDKFYITLNASKFITADNFNDDYFISFRKDSTATDYTDGSYFKGGELYCNYQCKIAAIGCYKTRNTIISDVVIHDCNIGIQTRTADDPDGNIKMQHCAIINSVAKAGTTAINDNAFDCIFDDITIVNFETAIYTIAGRFNQIRAWFNSGAAIGNSCFAIIDGHDVSLSNIAIDTYRYGFKVIATNGGACVSNVLVIRNTNIYPDSTIDIEPPFLVLHSTINPMLLMCNVSIPNDYKYTLFSSDDDANTCKLFNYRLGAITK